jgi:hypothetical protein
MAHGWQHYCDMLQPSLLVHQALHEQMHSRPEEVESTVYLQPGVKIYKGKALIMELAFTHFNSQIFFINTQNQFNTRFTHMTHFYNFPN